MPGSKPGERRGGRQKGGRNKSTIQKALIAEREIEKAKGSHRKLAKEYLQDFLPVLAGMAAYYQPLPAGMTAPPGREPNEDKFQKWFGLVLDTASKLAPYESPTFRAVVIAPPPQDPRGKVTRFTLEVFEHSGRAPIPTGGNGKIVEHEAGS